MTRAEVRARRWKTWTLFMACGAILAGCGSSEEGFGEFTGRWLVMDDTNSMVACDAGGPTGPLGLWSEVVLEPGTVSDLVDSGDGCRLPYDVKGKTATVPATNPYTGEATVCGAILETTTSVGVLELLPSAAGTLNFNLLQPMANMPPKAQLTGVISGRFLVFNATTMTLATTGPACSMTVLADLIKFSDL